MRQIVLDTETTGLRIEDGHRIIEIGCIELINRRITSNHFHYYINPQREIDAGAVAVHGITNDFLSDKPLFADILEDFILFIDGAELIIHNAAFDLSFLNNELLLANTEWKAISDHCTVLDTLPMARKLHPGQRNSLDAICKRYGIDNSKRELHGALLDANLLARAYLAMTGGQGSFFDAAGYAEVTDSTYSEHVTVGTSQRHQLIVLKANEDEISEHNKYLDYIKKKGQCLWEEQ